MRRWALVILLMVGGLAAGSPARAEAAAPFAAPGVSIEAVGIFCRQGTTRRETAPETSLGYIQLMDGLPEIAFRQDTVPARIGVQFGVIVTIDRDIPGVRHSTWKPGASKPETWFADHVAGTPRSRGFSFDLPDELVPGLWRMEAFDGEDLLYSVEFDVVPGTELPGVGSDCNLLS